MLHSSLSFFNLQISDKIVPNSKINIVHSKLSCHVQEQGVQLM